MVFQKSDDEGLNRKYKDQITTDNNSLAMPTLRACLSAIENLYLKKHFQDNCHIPGYEWLALCVLERESNSYCVRFMDSDQKNQTVSISIKVEKKAFYLNFKLDYSCNVQSITYIPYVEIRLYCRSRIRKYQRMLAFFGLSKDDSEILSSGNNVSYFGLENGWNELILNFNHSVLDFTESTRAFASLAQKRPFFQEKLREFSQESQNKLFLTIQVRAHDLDPCKYFFSKEFILFCFSSNIASDFSILAGTRKI